jgi:dissimilatory sulfite reductase (desulfoviridin) alpha/beta subunit
LGFIFEARMSVEETDNRPTWENCQINRETWLECEVLRLTCALQHARGAMRLSVYKYADAAKAARKHGYALAVHGSRSRDVDWLAFPWVENASPPEVVISAITEAVEGTATEKVTTKPHGRLSIVILANGTYIDLCVAPRLTEVANAAG